MHDDPAMVSHQGDGSRGEGAAWRAGDMISWVMSTPDAINNRLVNDESAATAIEYGLIAAGIAIVIIAAVASVGTNLNTTFSSVAGNVR
jgi:pilus assembly protein Flp/PilA